VTGVPESYILVSDSIYNKHLSSQCKYTTQIEQVQDKYILTPIGT